MTEQEKRDRQDTRKLAALMKLYMFNHTAEMARLCRKYALGLLTSDDVIQEVCTMILDDIASRR